MRERPGRNPRAAVITFLIEEGPQLLVRSVTFAGNKAIHSDELGNVLAVEVVESDPFIAAIQAHMTASSTRFSPGRHYWTGSMSGLLEVVKPARLPQDWPKTPSVASARLSHAIPALRLIGIDATLRRDKKGSLVTLDSGPG